MGSGGEARQRIGRVVAELRKEFPDVSISKLRFLEDRGIVTPERTPGGYRMYSAGDVEKLRTALRMQRDEFLPLKVIRGELERRLGAGGASGQGDAAPSRSVTESGHRPPGMHPPVGRIRLGEPEELVSATALVRAAGTSHDFLEECRQADIVAGRALPDGGIGYTVDEVGLVTLAASMAAIGIDVRHLRQAATAMGRQGALVEQFAAAVLRSPSAEVRGQGMQTVEELTARLAEFMRIAFVRDVKLMTLRTTEAGRGGDDGSGQRAARAAAARITRL